MSNTESDLVHVRFYAAARAAVGVAELRVETGSAEDILRKISGSNSQISRVFSLCSILVDGVILHDLSLEIAGGRDLDVLPPFAGGSD